MYINCLLVCQRQESYVYAGFDLVCRSSAKGSDAPGQSKSPLLWSWSLKLAQEVGGAEDMADGAGHQTEELKYDISPIAISLGSYMDKAAGRRACTGKKITQDVSVLSRSCLGDVSVMSRSCLGLVSVFFW